MRLNFFLFTLILTLISCSNSSNNTNDTSPADQNKNQVNQNAKSMCGEQTCDAETEFCYQEVSNARVLFTGEPGDTIWLYSFENSGEVKIQKCMKYDNRVSNNCPGAATTAHENNPLICKISETIECNIPTFINSTSSDLKILKCHTNFKF